MKEETKPLVQAEKDSMPICSTSEDVEKEGEREGEKMDSSEPKESGLKNESDEIQGRSEQPEFEPMSSRELVEILRLTIKKDEENKEVTCLRLLLACTKDSQFNISYNAPSSTGKSYIPIEIVRLFPQEDVIDLGHCSPTAFSQDNRASDERKKGYVVNLSRKIVTSLEQPHETLLQNPRPMLSHDKKDIRLKITDKSQKNGVRNRNICLKGFPSVILRSAGSKIDEQETTKLLLHSPKTSQKKIREGIFEKIKKEADSAAHQKWLNEDRKRQLLRARINTIKQAEVQNINGGFPEK